MACSAVAPIDAIRTGSLSARTRVSTLARVHLPGRTTTQLPLRNTLRAPRRTLMTMLGIAAAITVLIGVVGTLNSFTATIDRAHHELTRTAPRRLSVTLSSFLAASGDVLVHMLPLRNAMWTPSVDDQHAPATLPGIIITEKAASDLDVAPGDTLVLRHPERVGSSFQLVRSRMRIIGTSPLPTRSFAFMDSRDADLMDLEGLTNYAIVNPRAGVSTDQIERSLFGQPGIASVQPVREYTESIRNEIDQFSDILTIVEGAVLLLIMLIAFNSASINADERARDHATMFAFGLPPGSVLRMGMVESAIVGVLGTIVGIISGSIVLRWIVHSLFADTFPDLQLTAAIEPITIVIALSVGVLAVAVSPLLTAGRLYRMDIPSTLRVIE